MWSTEYILSSIGSETVSSAPSEANAQHVPSAPCSLTGVTLPLVSYGGTSVLTTILMFSIFEGICMIRQDEHYEAIERRKRREYRKEELEDVRYR